jgi:hypothetical protein
VRSSWCRQEAQLDAVNNYFQAPVAEEGFVVVEHDATKQQT